MIRINRGSKPNFLESDDVDLAIEKAKNFYASKNRNQKRYSFPFINKIDKELRPILFELFHEKCGYCETKIDFHNIGVVDRYRPYKGVRDQKEYFEDLYWWLTYNWENLIYSCKECSQYKSAYFPIEGKRALNKKNSLEKEKPLLINPCLGEPNLYFSYDDDGNIYSEKDEGVQTIELLKLNRTNLIESRKLAKQEVIEIVERIVKNGKDSIPLKELDYLQNIFNLEDPSIEFLSFKKWVLLNELDSIPFLGKEIGVEEVTKSLDWLNEFNENKKEEPVRSDFLKSDFFPIEYIEIENFKSISNLRIDFREDDIDKKSWLFLLGENGVGKSSILQAFAIGLKNNFKKDEIAKYGLIQKRKRKAIIRIKERNSDNIIETIITRGGDIINQKGYFDSFLLGYGSLRLSSSEVNLKFRKDIGKISYVNLFDPVLALNDITRWLKKIFKNKKDLFDRVAYAIKNLLPHDYSENELTIETGKIAFKNSDVLFTELSDGFKSTIVLAVDIMMKLSSANSDFDKVSGIVIIDELGNQLHPRWQMRIVTQLRLVFPNLNFIVSTHHPLCLRGTEEKEILLLKNVGKEVVAINKLPDPSSLRVDQILASEFFGLSSLIDPELEAKFNRYYELIAKVTTSKEENIELNKLKDELRNRKQLGATLREELMYHVIDKLLATKVVYNNEVIKRQELKEEVVQRVSDIWNSLKLDENDQS
jgi:uncharacterized protein (TIGR02646 family)